MYIKLVVVPSLIDADDFVHPLLDVEIIDITKIIALSLPIYEVGPKSVDLLDCVIDCEYSNSYHYYITLSYDAFISQLYALNHKDIPTIGAVVDAIHRNYNVFIVDNEITTKSNVKVNVICNIDRISIKF